MSIHFVSAKTVPKDLAEATVRGLRDQDDQFWICGNRGTKTVSDAAAHLVKLAIPDAVGRAPGEAQNGQYVWMWSMDHFHGWGMDAHGRWNIDGVQVAAYWVKSGHRPTD